MDGDDTTRYDRGLWVVQQLLGPEYELLVARMNEVPADREETWEKLADDYRPLCGR